MNPFVLNFTTLQLLRQHSTPFSHEVLPPDTWKLKSVIVCVTVLKVKKPSNVPPSSKFIGDAWVVDTPWKKVRMMKEIKTACLKSYRRSVTPFWECYDASH